MAEALLQVSYPCPSVVAAVPALLSHIIPSNLALQLSGQTTCQVIGDLWQSRGHSGASGQQMYQCMSNTAAPILLVHHTILADHAKLISGEVPLRQPAN